MKSIILSCFCYISLNFFAQSHIGFPFLNRDKVGPCNICDPSDPNDEAYLNKVDEKLIAQFGDKDFSKETYLKQIAFLDSILADSTLTDVVKARLINTKINWYCNGVSVNIDGSTGQVMGSTYMIYNYARSANVDNLNFEGPLYIIGLFDEILALDIDSTSKVYFRNVKLAYCAQTGIIQEINNANTEWLDTKTIPKNVKGAEKALAQNFLDTRKQTNYNPFVTYNAISPGVTTAIGKDLWYGFQVGFEPSIEVNNPFQIKHHALYYRTDTRISLLGIKVLYNSLNTDKTDLMFNAANIQNAGFLSVNLLQFGWHLHNLPENKMFYRPEIGFHYGIFTLSYAYNHTFNKEMRPLTEKHMINFTISYPLLRVSSYY
jgi:hypothetical protein